MAKKKVLPKAARSRSDEEIALGTKAERYIDAYESFLNSVKDMEAAMMDLDDVPIGTKISCNDGEQWEMQDLYKGRASRWHSVFAERIGLRKIRSRRKD